MFRYKLRTLLVLLAAVPPLLWFGWTKYEPWRAEQERQKAAAEISAEIDRLLLLEAKMLTGPPRRRLLSRTLCAGSLSGTMSATT